MSEELSPIESKRSWKKPAQRALGVVALAAAGLIGGTATASIFPSHVETAYYQADIRLSPLPSGSSRVHINPIFGDLNFEFSGIPAPGIEVSPQIKASLLDMVAKGDISLESFVPTTTEIDSVKKEAIKQIGLRFIGGVALGELIALGLLARRNPLMQRRLVAGGTAIAVGAGLTLGTGLISAETYQSYRSYNLGNASSESLLQGLMKYKETLPALAERTNQASPYITNFVLLAQALEKTFSAPETDKPVAAKFLLISDQHGVNQSELIKQIIKSENITAVVDTGDMDNFGTVYEAETAGFFDSIASLPVPYIFVDGNHDAITATDHALLDRLKAIPNVILPQYGDQYTIAKINGVTIAGYNDPNYTTGDDQNMSEHQTPSIEAFNQVMKSEETPDIVIAHEPAVAEVAKAGLTINGHMHKPTLDGNHIGVGTLTSGGLISQYRFDIGKDDNGQPASFDILSMDSTCQPESITRIIYNGVTQGKPDYNQLSVINGKTLGMKGRENAKCGPDQGITTRVIDATQKNDDLLLAGPTPSSTDQNKKTSH